MGPQWRFAGSQGRGKIGHAERYGNPAIGAAAGWSADVLGLVLSPGLVRRLPYYEMTEDDD